MRINEAVTDIVYHYTGTKKALAILKDGKINLTPTLRNETERNIGDNRFYYLSLTRSRHGAYHKENRVGVLFTLDGRKLSTNYRAQAVDYWDTFKAPNGVSLKDEMEDRIFTNDPQINIIKYVKEISILVNDSKVINHSVLPLYTLAKRHKIPVFVYDSREAWTLNDKRKALTLEQIKSLETEYRKPYTFRSSRRSRIMDIIELFHKSSKKDLTSSAKDMKGNFRYSDFKKSVAAELHNETGANEAGASENVRKMIEIMKKNKFKSFSDFMDYLKDKWDRIDKEEAKVEIMDRHKDQFDAILKALRTDERVDLSVFSGEDTEMKARMVSNMLWRMINYEIYIDEMQQFEPDFNPKHRMLGNVVDVLTLRLTGVLL